MLKNKIKENLNGRSLKSLERETGLSYPTISKIVKTNDLSNITMGSIVAIAQSLGTSVSELFDEITYTVSLTECYQDEEYSKGVIFNSYSREDCKKNIQNDFKTRENNYDRDIEKGDKIILIYSITENAVTKDEKNKLDTEDIVFDISSIYEKQSKYEKYKMIIQTAKEILEYSAEVIKREDNHIDSEFIFWDLEVFTSEVGMYCENLLTLDSEEELIVEMERIISEARKNAKEVRNELKALRMGV